VVELKDSQMHAIAQARDLSSWFRNVRRAPERRFESSEDGCVNLQGCARCCGRGCPFVVRNVETVLHVVAPCSMQ
jgi:hypothetical protein